MIIHNREKTSMTVPPASTGSFVRISYDPYEGSIQCSDGSTLDHDGMSNYYDTLDQIHYDALPNESVWIVPGTAPGE